MFDMLITTLLILIWPLCLLLIGLILLQGGAGDLSSAFGGGGQLDSTLGVGAGRKMSKVTAWLGAIFLVSVAMLGIPRGTLAGHRAVNEAPATVGGGKPDATMSPPASDVQTATPNVVVPPVEAPVTPMVTPPAPVLATPPAGPDAAPAPVVPAAAAPAPEAPMPAPAAAPAPAAVPAPEAAVPAPEPRKSSVTLGQ